MSVTFSRRGHGWYRLLPTAGLHLLQPFFLPGVLQSLRADSANDWFTFAQQPDDPTRRNWKHMRTASKAAQTSMGVDGTIVGVSPSGDVLRFDRRSQEWQGIPGNLTQITCGDANRICEYDPFSSSGRRVHR